MKLRPLTADDIEALTDLGRVCDETYLSWAPPGWTVPVPPRGWADPYLRDDAWILGGFDDGLVAAVGFRHHAEAVAHVGVVLVHPSRWRQGIARRLLGLAEDEMRARGFVRAQLWTPDGAPAEFLYQAMGWKRDGRHTWNPWVGLAMVGYAKDLL